MSRNPFKNLTKFEWCLWIMSLLAVCTSLLIGAEDYLSFFASMIGVTALIFVAKGDIYGQILTVIFCILYGIVSYTFCYYGEMITYLGMSLPAALRSVFTWLKNPYKEDNSEVKINKIKPPEYLFLAILAGTVTIMFYFILRYFNTPNLLFSTISVTTSFGASYLLMRRSPYYAVAYACNDIVLIVLWVLATIESISYISMVICFIMFLANDVYGFYNWRKMRKHQI